MRTTLDIPDTLARELRLRAASEGATLTAVITDVIRAGLAIEYAPESASPVTFPLVRGALVDGQQPLTAEVLASLEERVEIERLSASQ